MEEQKMDGQMPNIPAPFDYSKVMNEFPSMLKNAHDIIEDVVKLQYRVRFSSILVFFIAYALVCIALPETLEMTLINLAILVPGILVGAFFMVIFKYRKNWVYPGGKEWFTGQFVKIFYWRAYFRGTQLPTFNIQCIIPHVMGDMIVFVKDVNAILKERRNAAIAMLCLGIFLLILQIGLFPHLSLDSYIVMLIFICLAGGTMEIVLFVKMKRSFSSLIKKLEIYNRNVEEFWKRYW